MSERIEQAPGRLDIALVPGDDITFIIHSSIDLSGYTLAATSGNLTFAVSATSGMPAGYFYDVTITTTQSSGITADRKWQLDWTDGNSKKRRAISGTIKVLS